jgi:hypothetical protein
MQHLTNSVADFVAKKLRTCRAFNRSCALCNYLHIDDSRWANGNGKYHVGPLKKTALGAVQPAHNVLRTLFAQPLQPRKAVHVKEVLRHQAHTFLYASTRYLGQQPGKRVLRSPYVTTHPSIKRYRRFCPLEHYLAIAHSRLLPSNKYLSHRRLAE